MPIVFLLLPHLCLIRLRLFCYSQTDAYAIDGHLLVFSAMRRLMLMASGHLLSRPRPPAHLNVWPTFLYVVVVWHWLRSSPVSGVV